MYKLKIENGNGDILELSNEKKIAIIGIDGLNPPDASIVMSSVAMNDGSRFNSAKVEKRNLVITMRLLKDVERMRILLYKYFRIRQWCKIYFSNESRDVYCEGYVETFENDRFVMNNEVQVSIICPSPWFKQLDEVIFNMSLVLPMFEFPFAIEEEGVEFSVLQENILTEVVNGGDVETGLVLQLNATSEVINPRVYNADTHGMIGLNFTMQAGDVITISTIKGSKKVTLLREGVETNIINALMDDPDWFQIPIGSTNFTYDCTSGSEFFSVTFIGQNLYGGV